MYDHLSSLRAKSKHSFLSTHLFPFSSPTNHYSIDPLSQTSIKIKTGWHSFSYSFQTTPTGIYHWLLCNSHINKCQCPSQEHWSWCKPRLQSYCVLSLRILESMPAWLPGCHLENRSVWIAQLLCDWTVWCTDVIVQIFGPRKPTAERGNFKKHSENLWWVKSYWK